MKKLIIMTLFAAGCGTIFNKRMAQVELDPGVSIDGATGSTEIDQKEHHTVTYADGRTCEIHPGVGAAYVIVDLFLTGPLGIIVDAVTGGWTIAKGDCDGVYKK